MVVRTTTFILKFTMLSTRTTWHKRDIPCPENRKFTQTNFSSFFLFSPIPFPCSFSVLLCEPCNFISASLGLGFFPTTHSESQGWDPEWVSCLDLLKDNSFPLPHWNPAILASRMHWWRRRTLPAFHNFSPPQQPNLALGHSSPPQLQLWRREVRVQPSPALQGSQSPWKPPGMLSPQVSSGWMSLSPHLHLNTETYGAALHLQSYSTQLSDEHPNI